MNDYEALFLSSLPVVDDVVRKVARRHHLTAAEADDFASEIRLRFVESEYEPLRKFEARSSLRTYLTVCINHLFLDYRNRQWGKWRPSADAKRAGPAAILLDRFVTRDGCGLDEAVERLRLNHGVEMDDALRALCLKLAARQPVRQIVPVDEATDVASQVPSPDANVVRAAHDFLAKRVRAAMNRARQALTADERLILRMRFDEGAAVSDIARALQLDQKRLYRTIERILAALREHLEAEGIAKDEVTALLADGELDPGEAA